MQYTSNLGRMQTWRKLSVPCIQLLGQTSSSHGNNVRRWLEPGETWRLAVPFGRATDCILECAFWAGIPDDISRLLRVSWRLDELLARTQNILKDIELVAVAARTTETPSERQYAADAKATRKLKMLHMWWS